MKLTSNVAHSVNGAGHWIYPDKADPTSGSCFEISNLAGYKNIREAVASYFISNKVIMRNVTCIDNMVGESLQLDGETVEMRNLKIFGGSQSPDCPPDGGFCFGGTKIGMIASIAVGKSKKRHIISPSNYPHSKIKGEPHFNGKIIMHDILFKGFTKFDINGNK